MIDVAETAVLRRTCRPRDIAYKVARSEFELEGFRALRRRVFCEEQKIFVESDTDADDEAMIPIVCVMLVAGMEDRVIGTVRIHESGPGIWWGSRLGVDHEFRRLRCRPPVSIRNDVPVVCAQSSVGAGLVSTAVTTARSLGCRAFFAYVQQQNRAFFQKLGWRALEEVEFHSRPHIRMQADLSRYPLAESGEGVLP